MANLAMNSIVRDWSTQSTTPAGYPGVPGHQPASAQARSPHTGATNPHDTRQGVDCSGQSAYGTAQAGAEGCPVSSSYEGQMASHEAMMNVPTADAVDRGTMTYDDVVVKSLICSGLLLAGATAGWLTDIVTLGAAMLMALDAYVVTSGLDLFIRFLKMVRPAAIITYSLVEGFVLDTLSFTFESMCPGTVVTAVVATLVVIDMTLAVFATGFVRSSSALACIAGIGCTTFFSYYMTSLVFSVIGLVDMTTVNSAKIFGIPLGIIVGVLAVFIGVLRLVRDFGAVKVDVANNVPEKYSRLCTFTITADAIWIYLGVLGILSYLMRHD